MLIRRFIAMLIGLAMALTPLGMPAAATPPPASHHEMLRMDHGSMSHCDGKTKPAHQKKAADKSCCAATCIGLAVASSETLALTDFSAAILRPVTVPFLSGIPTELPTPPPRAA